MKQIYPASITGKGSTGTGGTEASVLEHNFGKSDPYTLGVEEEYMLLDPETWDLVQHIDSVLGAVADGEHQDRIHAELMQSVLEVTTPVCRTAADVHRSLCQLRGYVAEVARSEGCRFGSAGTHPFSLFERQRITARDRYRNLVDQLQYIARRELIFGMHMHVAVDDPEKAIQVMNGLLVHLPQMLALSASSPFWRGEPTGLSSSRQMVFAAFPRSGPPPRFKDYADYAEVVGQLERTGCIADYTHIWWDIRPHPRLGTIEMRVCDAVTRVEDVVAITSFFQAIVKMYCELYDAGKAIPTWHRLLTTENKWLAARYGLEAPVMDLATGRRNRVPVAQLIRRTLRDVEPHARELGSERELEGVREILARGNGADRQLRVWNANRDIVEVVREISAATEEAVVTAASEALPS
ncbi:MAG TPA: carboxylate-amine ligase [Gaiellaceae bacterium]